MSSDGKSVGETRKQLTLRGLEKSWKCIYIIRLEAFAIGLQDVAGHRQ